MYVSRVQWRNPGKGVLSPLYFSVVAIEKGAFWSPSLLISVNALTYGKLYCHFGPVGEVENTLYPPAEW